MKLRHGYQQSRLIYQLHEQKKAERFFIWETQRKVIEMFNLHGYQEYQVIISYNIG